MGVWTHRTDGNSRRAIRAYTCAKVKENNGTLVGHACGPLTSFALGEKSFRTPCIAFYRDHAGIRVAMPRLLPLRSEPIWVATRHTAAVERFQGTGTHRWRYRTSRSLRPLHLRS